MPEGVWRYTGETREEWAAGRAKETDIDRGQCDVRDNQPLSGWDKTTCEQMKRISFLSIYTSHAFPFPCLDCVRGLPQMVLAEGLLSLDLVIGQRLELALVVLVRNLLVLLNHRCHGHLAACRDVVGGAVVHDPVFVS